MYISKKLLAIATASLLGAAFSFPASAETISGQLEDADQDSIVGWVWDTEDYNHILNVELHIYPAGSEKEIVTLTTKADFYRDDLQTSIGDGYHGFTCPVDWDSLEGNDFSVTAYAVSEEGKTQLPETVSYKKISTVEPNRVEPLTETAQTLNPGQTAGPGSKADSQDAALSGSFGSPVSGQAPVSPVSSQNPDGSASGQAPGSPASSQNPGSPASGQSSDSTAQQTKVPSYWLPGPGVPKPAPEEKAIQKGESLGLFITSGYCTCELCSSGENLTFSGTVPQANHTVSADLTLLPINTKVIINDIVYTVEDKGSSVIGNHIDIFYASHEEAVAHGIQEAEVFLVK